MKKNILHFKNTDTLIIYLTLFFCFEPKIAVKIPLFNNLYIVGAVLMFLVVFFISFCKRRDKISKLFYVLVLFRLSFAVQTFLNHGDILMWGYLSMVLISLCLLFDCFSDNDPYIFVNALVNVLLFLVVMNFFVSLPFPEGVIDGIFFIGIRTRIGDVVIPLLLFCFIRDTMLKKKYTVKTIVACVFSLGFIFKYSVMTSLIGVIVFSIGYIMVNTFGWLNKVSLKKIVYGGFVLSILFVFFDISNLFSPFFEIFFHKEGSLSSRTILWNEASKYIWDSPLFGHGMAQDGGFILWGYIGGEQSLWQAHNTMLQVLYDGGLLSLSSLLVLMVMNDCVTQKYIDKKITKMILVTMCAFMLMMIPEIYVYTPYFFLVIFAINILEILIKEEAKN